MNDWSILWPILIPAIGAGLVFLVPRKNFTLQLAVALVASAAQTALTILLFGSERAFFRPWVGFGINFDLRLYSFSAMIVLVAAFTFLTVLFSATYMRNRENTRQFFGFVLLASSFVTGAMLANNLVLMLFFWEGLLGMLFGLIYTGGKNASATAVKALVINGLADLCLILGVCIVGWRAQTLSMIDITIHLDSYWDNFAFVMMLIGAIGKAGSMPFHTWIPDAAVETNASFMAFLPAAMDKLLGIYLLARLNLDLFVITPHSRMSNLMLVVGCITLIFAVMMALIQKDYRRLLGYHAVSQVGYMIIGIGTGLTVGIVGGLFHMINNAIYKSCLYFTAGAVETQTGTTDLKLLGGLAKKMPVTCIGFIIAALSIAGVPPFNGFYSKELVFDAALETNVIFYIIALLGAFCTAASFLKLGHTVYFGQETRNTRDAEEAPATMLMPIIILAAACVLCGVWNALPLEGLIEPILGEAVEHTFSGLIPHDWLLPVVSLIVLLAAFINHRFGVKKSGKPVSAVDHIHHAPGLRSVYDYVETGALDTYRGINSLVESFSSMFFAIDRAIDWVYMSLVTGTANLLAGAIEAAHTGKHWMYVLWTVVGGIAVVVIMFWFGG